MKILKTIRANQHRILIISVGIFLITGSALVLYQTHVVRSSWVNTTGYLTSYHYIDTHSRKPDNADDYYKGDISFEVDDQTYTLKNARLSNPSSLEPKMGEMLFIHYNPDNPEQSALGQRASHYIGAVAFAILGVIFLLGGLFAKFTGSKLEGPLTKLIEARQRLR